MKRVTLESAALTDSAHHEALKRVLERLPHSGKIFLPDDDFYMVDRPQKRARRMLKLLCEWLNIKPGYIHLVFEHSRTIPREAVIYDISIDRHTLHDEFKLGHHVACELTKYLLLHRHSVRLKDDRDVELLAEASVRSGLGLVILNGWDPTYNVFQAWRKRLGHSRLFGQLYSRDRYAAKVKNFLNTHQIPAVHYQATLMPWTARYLGAARLRKLTKAVHDVRHQALVNNFKIVAIAWLLLMLSVLTVYISGQRVRPEPPHVAEAHQKMNLLASLKNICDDWVDYRRQYTDVSDIQAARWLGGEELRCQSLANQHAAAERKYRELKQ